MNGKLGRKGGREGGKEGRPKLTCSWRFCDLAAFSPSPSDPERRLPPRHWLVMVDGCVLGACVCRLGREGGREGGRHGNEERG